MCGSPDMGRDASSTPLGRGRVRGGREGCCKQGAAVQTVLLLRQKQFRAVPFVAQVACAGRMIVAVGVGGGEGRLQCAYGARFLQLRKCDQVNRYKC